MPAQIRYNILRKHQASVSASLGLARWLMQNMQSSEFLHLLGHSLGSAVSWDVFRGDGTARRFRGYFYGFVFSLGLGGWSFFFVFLSAFKLPAFLPARSAVFIYSLSYRTFKKSVRNFVSLGAGRYMSCK